MIYNPVFRQICWLCGKVKRLVHISGVWRIFVCDNCDYCER